MIFGSVCSGIEAASVAWHPLGWRAAFVSEIDKFPCAVLAHHYPNVPNFGDMTHFKDWPDVSIDVLVGGTPCQSFSVAGLRQGMADPRGNLALTYLAIADRFKPRWLIWENVPGVLSSNDGRDFGAIIGGMGQLGYGLAYRVLDAQYVRVDGLGRAVAQRRRRVFVVGYLGDWRRAAAVLFERESLHGDTPPRRTQGQGVARPIARGSERGSGYRNDADTADNLIADPIPLKDPSSKGEAGSLRNSIHGRPGDPMFTLTSGEPHGVLAFGGNNTAGPIDVATARSSHAGPHGRLDFESETFVAHALRADGFDASEDGTGRGTPLIAVETTGHQDDDVYSHDAPTWPTLAANSANNGGGAILMQPLTFPWQQGGTLGMSGTLVKNQTMAVAFDMCGREGGSQFEGPHDTANIRAASGGSSKSYAAGGFGVRRLTPVECARLQGFPDNYLTQVPWRGKSPPPDGPQYKALGNSMATNCMRWIGMRIDMVEAVMADTPATRAAE